LGKLYVAMSVTGITGLPVFVCRLFAAGCALPVQGVALYGGIPGMLSAFDHHGAG
jgi:hypothetical protein